MKFSTDAAAVVQAPLHYPSVLVADIPCDVGSRSTRRHSLQAKSAPAQTGGSHQGEPNALTMRAAAAGTTRSAGI